jgi:prepilin-type processing-associated H-X9-DG protein
VDPVNADLTGGLDLSLEYACSDCPDSSGMRESVTMWISDDRGEIGMPRVGIDAMAPNWDTHNVQVNIAFADGRVYRLREAGKTAPPAGPDGRPTVFGAGPLLFHCVKPFELWTASFQGTAIETSTTALLAGNDDGPRVGLEFTLEASMAVPAWAQGTLLPETAALIETSEQAKIVQGRYEQLFRAKGLVRVRGEEYGFDGSGVRVRRRGPRPLRAFRGAILHSALFPSGRAFAYIVHAPRADGSQAFNEGYLFEGRGSLIPARVIRAPWMTQLQAKGADASVELESELGITAIEGETVLSTFDVVRRSTLPNFPILRQGTVRCRWDGEETFGIMENTMPRDQLKNRL